MYTTILYQTYQLYYIEYRLIIDYIIEILIMVDGTMVTQVIIQVNFNHMWLSEIHTEYHICVPWQGYTSPIHTYSSTSAHGHYNHASVMYTGGYCFEVKIMLILPFRSVNIHLPWFPQLTSHSILVGGWPTPLKNMSSSVGIMKFPNIWKNKKCSKPPTSIYHILHMARD